MSTANRPVDRAVATYGGGGKRGKSVVRLAAALLLPAVGAHALRAASGAGVRPPQELVESITNAPVVPDGVVTARAADFVITLDSDLDPRVPGRSLLAGRSIRVMLPDAFNRDPAIPSATLFSIPDCMPLNVRCDTAFLLQEWPQHPVGFPPPNMPSLWTVDFDGATNSVIVTALQDLRADPPNEPGIKQLHLVLAGFANPRPGRYVVRVFSETGRNRVRLGAAAHPTARQAYSCFDERVQPGRPKYHLPNCGHQRGHALSVRPAVVGPHWCAADRRDGPTNQSRGSGAVAESPPGGVHLNRRPRPSTRSVLLSEIPSFSAVSPVVGVPTARLRVFFTTGDTPGAYVLRFGLFGGNSVETFVTVE